MLFLLEKDKVYKLLKNIIDDNFITKKPLYHWKCWSDYTHKKTFALINVKTCDKDEPVEQKSNRCNRQPVDFKEVCFLCLKVRDKKEKR